MIYTSVRPKAWYMQVNGQLNYKEVYCCVTQRVAKRGRHILYIAVSARQRLVPVGWQLRWGSNVGW